MVASSIVVLMMMLRFIVLIVVLIVSLLPRIFGLWEKVWNWLLYRQLVLKFLKLIFEVRVFVIINIARNIIYIEALVQLHIPLFLRVKVVNNVHKRLVGMLRLHLHRIHPHLIWQMAIKLSLARHSLHRLHLLAIKTG